MDEETKDDQLLHRLFEQVNQHIETRWAYFSLTATEKASGIASDFAGAVTILVFGLLVLFFLTFGLAWWLGDLIQHRAGGFALTGLVFMPIGFVIYKWIRPLVRTKIIEAIMQESATEKQPNYE